MMLSGVGVATWLWIDTKGLCGIVSSIMYAERINNHLVIVIKSD